MLDFLWALVSLLVCGAGAALVVALLRRCQRRAAVRAVLLELGRWEPLPAPDEDLAIGRVMALLDAQEVVAAEHARVAGLYEEPTRSAPGG